jgi:hypothetical protein
LKRTKKEPKLTLEAAVTDLRKQGFKPNYDVNGCLVDWRRIRGHKLITAEVTVHTSGRITVHQRGTANGKRGHEPSRSKDTTT